MAKGTGKKLLIKCTYCQNEFYPFGQKKMIAPVAGTYVCPSCKNELQVIWDQEIARERYRQSLGIKAPIGQTSPESAISITELKYEILTIKSQLEDLSEQISDLKNTIEVIIPETQELIKTVITEIMMEQVKSKKPGLNPV